MLQTDVKIPQLWERPYECPVSRAQANNGALVVTFKDVIADWLASRATIRQSRSTLEGPEKQHNKEKGRMVEPGRAHLFLEMCPPPRNTSRCRRLGQSCWLSYCQIGECQESAGTVDSEAPAFGTLKSFRLFANAIQIITFPSVMSRRDNFADAFRSIY
jgi:hypothetical protein